MPFRASQLYCNTAPHTKHLDVGSRMRDATFYCIPRLTAHWSTAAAIDPAPTLSTYPYHIDKQYRIISIHVLHRPTFDLMPAQIARLTDISPSSLAIWPSSTMVHILHLCRLAAMKGHISGGLEWIYILFSWHRGDVVNSNIGFVLKPRYLHIALLSPDSEMIRICRGFSFFICI